MRMGRKKAATKFISLWQLPSHKISTKPQTSLCRRHALCSVAARVLLRILAERKETQNEQVSRLSLPRSSQVHLSRVTTCTRHLAHTAEASRTSKGCCWQFHYHLFLYNLPTVSVPYNTVRPLFSSAARDIPETLHGGNAQLLQESYSAVPSKGWDRVGKAQEI